MSSYRFCRTDDIGLLVDALNRCWAPHFPDEPAVTPASFKRWIRDLQVWCSSCMVAFAGGDPIAVLIGAKRPSATLVHRIAIHPDHLRQGHGGHLLTSLSSKLAILGPPRILAEVPETLPAGRELFESAGYARETALTDYCWQGGSGNTAPPIPDTFMIPVTVDDLVANGLLDDPTRPLCWERSAPSLTARKQELAGLAVASNDRIEAYVLHSADEIVLLRSLVDDGGARLRQLLARLTGRAEDTMPFRKVHPGEIAPQTLDMLGFRPAARHIVYAATARSS